jgi:hypothetical protein
MKQHIVRFLHAGCLCLAATLPSTFAQSGQPLTVDLPFGFQISGQQFPSGKYQVTASPGQTAVLIRGVDCKRATFSLTNGIQSGTASEKSTLVFHRYGDRYFLSQIWLGGSNSGRVLMTSPAEREVARRLAKSTPNSATEVAAVLGPLDAGR